MTLGAVVCSGFNQRAVVAALRLLRARDIPHGVVALPEFDPIRWMSAEVVARRAHRRLVLADVLSAFVTVRSHLGVDELVVIPTTEALNRFLLDHRAVFADEGIRVPLVDSELYCLISDKESFLAAMGAVGIEVPVRLAEPPEFSDVPYVVRPRRYRHAIPMPRPVVVRSPADHDEVRRCFDPSLHLVEEFVGGGSFYVLMHIGGERGVSVCGQRNLAQQPGGMSIVAAMSAEPPPHVVGPIVSAFTGLGFKGLVMVEVRLQDDRWVVIEANPRLWGPSQLVLDAGMPLFDDFLVTCGLTDADPPTHQSGGGRYFWFGGLAATTRTGRRLDFYGIDESDFLADLPAWLESDVYRRPDTIEWFVEELVS